MAAVPKVSVIGLLAALIGYDSGLVAGSVGSLSDALGLTPAQQAAIGFFCGNQFATPDNGVTSCNTNFGATRLKIPAEGTENDDHNPRIAPRHLFDIGVGTDNLYSTGDGKRITPRFTVSNLTTKSRSIPSCRRSAAPIS